MATADDDFNAECWNEICEDIECDDTNYHATIEELMERVRRNSNEIEVINEAEDIVLQAEFKSDDDNSTDTN